MQLTIRVFKHMVTADMHSHVLFPEPFVQTLQLLAEVSGEVRKRRKTGVGVAEQTSVCLIRMKTHNDAFSILQLL